jgi:RNA polymerase sigma-70 factor, ECF subfamily
MNQQARQAAFVALVEPHQKLLRRICRTFALTPADRDDLFQDVLYQLWRSYASFEGRSKITTWLYQVAVNTAVTRARRISRRPSEVRLDQLAVEPPARETVVQDERAQVLEAAIESLEPVDRTLILLYLDDISYREMSEILGVSENVVGVRLNRARARLTKAARGCL